MATEPLKDQGRLRKANCKSEKKGADIKKKKSLTTIQKTQRRVPSKRKGSREVVELWHQGRDLTIAVWEG